MWRCEDLDLQVWGCEDVDLQLWGCEDVDQQVWGCEDVDLQMWKCEDVDLQMWRCEDLDLQVWGCEDVDLQMWGCEDVDQQVWGCEDVDQQMWGCEDVDQQMCRSAGVRVWRCSMTAAFLWRTLRRRPREKISYNEPPAKFYVCSDVPHRHTGVLADDVKVRMKRGWRWDESEIEMKDYLTWRRGGEGKRRGKEQTPTPTHLARSGQTLKWEGNRKAEADGHGTRPGEGGEDGSAWANLTQRNLCLPRYAQDPIYLGREERIK